MGSRAKSQFCSVLLNEFHLRTKLMALLFSDFVFKRELSTQNYKTLSLKGTYHTNYDSKWKNENLGKRISSENKSDGTFVRYLGVQKQNKILRILKFRFQRVPYL
jgi:hypothetical protein